MKFLESMGEWSNRIRRAGPRAPCRTFDEIAEEFGVTPRTLTAFMGHYPGAPRPLMDLGKGKIKAKWYDQAAFRAWWKTVPRK